MCAKKHFLFMKCLKKNLNLMYLSLGSVDLSLYLHIFIKASFLSQGKTWI